jgi:hypothetical protein
LRGGTGNTSLTGFSRTPNLASGIPYVRAASEFVLNGKNQTVAGISDSEGRAVIENRHLYLGDPGVSGSLTVNNATDCYFNGLIWDGSSDGATTLGIVNSGGL